MTPEAFIEKYDAPCAYLPEEGVSFMTLDAHSAGYVYDDLDDILYEMDEDAFEDEQTWGNTRHMLIGILGDGDEDVWHSTSSVILYDTQTGMLHQLDIAPVDVQKFDQLPVIAPSLEAFAQRLG